MSILYAAQVLCAKGAAAHCAWHPPAVLALEAPGPSPRLGILAPRVRHHLRAL